MILDFVNSVKSFRSLFISQIWKIRNSLFLCKGNNIRYRRYHSQFGEDKYIFENIKFDSNAVFMDVGAGHPVFNNNTYFFEKNNWYGVCIDADPKQYSLLKEKRKNVVWAAISESDGEVELYQSYISTYSSTLGNYYNRFLKVPFKRKIKVPSFRLETILSKGIRRSTK